MKIVPIEVGYIQHCGSDLSVVNAARVSFHKESEWEQVPPKELFEKPKHRLSDRDAKLISYLASHGHISPFHHAFITLRVKAPVFVARQLVKHKFMPWNEVSRRYVDDEPEFYFPDIWRNRAENVKQGSASNGVAYDYPKSSAANCLNYYYALLGDGVAPEQARMVLPQNTMTEWYWSGTLSAWASMLNLRLKPEAQQETREVAEKCKDILLPLFPVSLKALLENEIVH